MPGIWETDSEEWRRYAGEHLGETMLAIADRALGRDLTSEEAFQLVGCLEHSSIPVAVATILVDGMGLSASEQDA